MIRLPDCPTSGSDFSRTHSIVVRQQMVQIGRFMSKGYAPAQSSQLLYLVDGEERTESFDLCLWFELVP